MRNNVFKSLVAIIVLVVFLASCHKDKTPDPPAITPPTVNNNLNGLGDHMGYPTGTAYNLPSFVQLVGEIRGGTYKKSASIDKRKYQGSFPIQFIPKSWTNYGTGTFVQLYLKLYNTLPNDTTMIFPGGLIFCDTLSTDTTNGEYQSGLILQNDTVQLLAQDTSYVVLLAYCLNASLSSSYFDAVYYMGPVTNNSNLNQMITIMSQKQYPYGEEYELQGIIWDITDYGNNLSSQDIQYLNALP